MRDRKTLEKVDRGIKNLRFVWIALLGSLFLYVFLAIYLRNTIAYTIQGVASSVLRWILYLVSVITFVLGYYIRKMLMNSKRALKGWSQAMGNDHHPAVARYTTAVVTVLAVAESIGIYGLILYVVFGNISDLISLMLFSAIAMFIYRPRREELIKVMTSQPFGSIGS